MASQWNVYESFQALLQVNMNFIYRVLLYGMTQWVRPVSLSGMECFDGRW